MNRILAAALDAALGEQDHGRRRLHGLGAVATGAALATAVQVARHKHLRDFAKLGVKLTDLPSLHEIPDAVRDRLADYGLIHEDGVPDEGDEPELEEDEFEPDEDFDEEEEDVEDEPEAEEEEDFDEEDFDDEPEAEEDEDFDDEEDFEDEPEAEEEEDYEDDYAEDEDDEEPERPRRRSRAQSRNGG